MSAGTAVAQTLELIDHARELEARRERLQVLLDAPGTWDGKSVQFYGDGSGFVCLVCGHASNQEQHIGHDPDAAHCAREMNELMASAAWLRKHGIRANLKDAR